MKRSTWLSLALWLAGCGAIQGNGQLESQEHDRTGFVRVRAEGQVEVVVRDGAEHKVVVTGDSNLLEYVATHVDGDTLVIDEARDGVWIEPTTLRVEVSLPMARALESSGAGALRAELTSAGEDLELVHRGAGAVWVTGAFAHLTTRSAGAGAATFAGTADAWTADLSGAGSVDGRGLTVEDAHLTNSGVGSLSATVRRTLAASVTGLGSIHWWGPAAVTSSERTGLGNIVHH